MKVVGNKLHTEHMTITFHRTLCLPDDGRVYPLPASLGHFPLKRIEDYKDKVPAEWLEKGGIFLPMHPREAMWLGFQKKTHIPCAVRVGVGKVNAVTGEIWKAHLQTPQDYLVAPPQSWLDGIKGKDGTVRQFVAMALGQGYTVEGQVTGKEDHGGIQLAIYPGKADRFPEPVPQRRNLLRAAVPTGKGAGGMSVNCCASGEVSSASSFVMADTEERTRGIAPMVFKAAAMGMGAGGSMTQEIYKDPHGVDAWDQTKKERVFVHLVNAAMYLEITGEIPPPSPVTRAAYEQSGIPWFYLQDEGLPGTDASAILNGVKTISQMDQQHGFEGQQDNTSIEVGATVSAGTPQVAFDKETVQDGSW